MALLEHRHTKWWDGLAIRQSQRKRAGGGADRRYAPSRWRDKSKHVCPSLNTLVRNHLEEMTFWGVFGDPVAENVALQSHLLKGSVLVEPVESQNTVSTPTLREQELCQSTERCEKMRLRDAHPATVRTPDRSVVLVAGE